MTHLGPPVSYSNSGHNLVKTLYVCQIKQLFNLIIHWNTPILWSKVSIPYFYFFFSWEMWRVAESMQIMYIFPSGGNLVWLLCHLRKAVLALGHSWIWEGHGEVYAAVFGWPACFKAHLWVGSVLWWGDLQKFIQCFMYLQTVFSRLAFCEYSWNCKNSQSKYWPGSFVFDNKKWGGQTIKQNPPDLEIWPCRGFSVALLWLTELTVPSEWWTCNCSDRSPRNSHWWGSASQRKCQISCCCAPLSVTSCGVFLCILIVFMSFLPVYCCPVNTGSIYSKKILYMWFILGYNI